MNVTPTEKTVSRTKSYNATLLLRRDGKTIGVCLARELLQTVYKTSALDCVYSGRIAYHSWLMKWARRLPGNIELWLNRTRFPYDYYMMEGDPFDEYRWILLHKHTQKEPTYE